MELSHGMGLGVAVLLLELARAAPLMAGLDALDELGPHTGDGAANLGSHKEGVELGEYTEHLVGVLGRRQVGRAAGR